MSKTTKVTIQTKQWVSAVNEDPSEDFPEGRTIPGDYWDTYLAIAGAVTYQGPQQIAVETGEAATDDELVQAVKDLWASTGKWELA